MINFKEISSYMKLLTNKTKYPILDNSIIVSDGFYYFADKLMIVKTAINEDFTMPDIYTRSYVAGSKKSKTQMVILIPEDSNKNISLRGAKLSTKPLSEYEEQIYNRYIEHIETENEWLSFFSESLINLDPLLEAVRNTKENILKTVEQEELRAVIFNIDMQRVFDNFKTNKESVDIDIEKVIKSGGDINSGIGDKDREINSSKYFIEKNYLNALKMILNKKNISESKISYNSSRMYFIRIESGDREILLLLNER